MRALALAVLIQSLLLVTFGGTRAVAAPDPPPSPLDASWVGMPLPFAGQPANPELRPRYSASIEFGGLLLLSGSFEAVGHLRARNIVAWDGAAFRRFGDLPGEASSFCVWNDTLYAFVQLFDRPSELVLWDGSQWRVRASIGSSIVRTLLVSSGQLVLAGDIFSIDGEQLRAQVVTFDGASWHALAGLGPSQSVTCAAAFQDTLYVGLDRFGFGSISGVARWDGGQWSAVGLSSNSFVSALVTDGRSLYAAGSFRQGGPRALTGVWRWDGTAWQSVGNGEPLSVVSGPISWNGALYVAQASGPDAVLRFDGSTWSSIHDGLGGQVAQLVATGTRLVALLKPDARLANGQPAQVMVDDEGLWRSAQEPWSEDMLGIGSRTSDATVYNDSLVIATDAAAFVGDGAEALPGSQELVWSGSAWAAPIPNSGPGPQRIGVWGDRLLACGDVGPPAAGTGIRRWDGSSWQDFGAGPTAGVRAFAAHGEDLFAGGSFTTGTGFLPGFLPHIARWDGTQWNRVGDGVATPGAVDLAVVHAMVDSDAGVILGGHFTFATGVTVQNIARWDGVGFSPLAGGLDGDCLALAAWNGMTVAGGTFAHADSVAAPGAAYWDGTAWHAMGRSAISVTDFAQIDGRLYAVGDFIDANGDTANTIARWSGVEWRTLGSGAPAGSGSLTWTEGHHGDLYAGGSLAWAFGRASAGMIRLPAANSVGPRDESPVTEATMRAAPNPGIDGTTFQFALPSDGHVRLTVFDANGRAVATLVDATLPAGHHDARWAAPARPGVYFAKLEAPGGAMRTARVVRIE